MDLKELLKNSNVSINGNQERNTTDFVRIPTETAGYKLVYPMKGEKLSIRIFLNEKSGRVFRDIHRHEYTLPSKYTVKTPCLRAMYEMDCPVCNAIKNIKDIKGDDALTGTMKYSKRFIMFAHINSIENKSSVHEVNAGENVLLMVPSKIASELANIMNNCKSMEDINKFFNSNNCLSFVISVDNNVSTEMYKIMPDALTGQTKLFENDEDYIKLSQSFPSLNDLIVPATFNDDYLKLGNQVVDSLNKEFLSSSIEQTKLNNIDNETKANDILNSINKIANEVQPQSQVGAIPVQQVVQQQENQNVAAQVVQPSTTIVQPQINQNTVVSNISQPQPVTVTTEAPVNNPGVPACFGNYNELEAKCLICSNSVECSTKKLNN